MGILTLLRNAFGRSRKGRSAEGEPSHETPTASGQATPQGTEAAGIPAQQSSDRSDEHDLVSAAFSNVTVPRQATSTSPTEAERPTEAAPEPTATPAAEPEAEVTPDTQPEPAATPDPEPEAEATTADTEAEVTAEPEPEAEAAVAAPAPEPEADVTPLPEPEVEAATAHTEPTTEATTEAGAAPTAEPEAEAAPEPAAEATPDTQPEPTAPLEPEAEVTPAETEPEATAAPAVEVTPDAAPEPTASPEPEATAVPDTEPETESTPAETEPAAEATAEPEPEAAAAAEPAAAAVPDPEPEPEATAGPAPEATPDPEPEAEATPAETEPEATAEPTAEATPDAQPEPTASPEPAADATPDPEPEAASVVAGGDGGLHVLAPGLGAAHDAAAAALDQHGLTGTRARVYLVLDRSASMRPYYKDGSAQALGEQTLALAAHLDPEATVHVVFFSTELDGTGELTLTEHENKIDDLHAGLGRMGRTSYHVAVEAVTAHHARSADPSLPALVVFQTDGAPDAKTPATQALTDAAAKHPGVFFSFVAFGTPENKAFDYIRKLRTDNTSAFLAGETPRELTDAEVYEGVLASWRP
ncbi:VWA domain-containing protein [Streptomyces sp. NPDC048664]|uniref:VWA domain-containing protein n=1 Tax=Streptomyces sp. NPDC048664 TaxID=3154505 RepID=UPI00344907CA